MTVDKIKYCTEEAADWLCVSLLAACRLSPTTECRAQVMLLENQHHQLITWEWRKEWSTFISLIS